MAAKTKRKRNPLVLLIYMVFVWPAYVVRWFFGLFVKIVSWIGKLAERIAKDGFVRRMHDRGGLQGFMAILIDLAMAAVIWAALLYALGERTSGNLFEWF